MRLYPAIRTMPLSLNGPDRATQTLVNLILTFIGAQLKRCFWTRVADSEVIHGLDLPGVSWNGSENPPIASDFGRVKSQLNSGVISCSVADGEMDSSCARKAHDFRTISGLLSGKRLVLRYVVIVPVLDSYLEGGLFPIKR
jgi:hypothetical protein